MILKEQYILSLKAKGVYKKTNQCQNNFSLFL